MLDITQVPASIWQNFWGKSHPLSSIFLQLQSQERQAEYKALQAACKKQGIMAKLQDPEKRNAFEAGSNGSGFMGVLSDILGAANAQMDDEYWAANKAFNDIQDQFHTDCKRWIVEGQVVPVGYAKDRRPEDLACLVSLDLSSRGYYDWNANTINHDTLKMVDIRVGNPKLLEELLAKFGNSEIPEQLSPKTSGSSGNPTISTPETSGSSKNQKSTIIPEMPEVLEKGRPSKREIMWKSYIECIELDLIDFSKSRKHAYRVVISYMQKNYSDGYGDGKGFSDRTFLKLIKENFDSNLLNLKD